MSDNIIHVSDDSFEQEVLQSEMPVLIDYWAEWCGPCKQLSPTVEEIAVENQDKLKVCKMDVDSNREIAAKYGIRSIPSLIIFKNGELVNRQVGVSQKNVYADYIDALL